MIINMFIFYSIVGHYFEELVCFIFSWTNDTLFSFPWIPLYGLAIVVMYYLDKYYKHKHIYNKLLFTIFITFLFTIFEYLTGIITEQIFHVISWNYDNLPFHYGHYVALPISLFWMILIYIINYFINPYLIKYFKSINKWITISFSFWMIIDIIFVFLRH